MNKQPLPARLFLWSLFVFYLLPATITAATINLNANDSLTAVGAWTNVPYCYTDDALYTTGKGINKSFTVGLADPVDTVNMGITNVVVYVKGFSSYSKGKIRLTVNKGGIDTVSGTYNFGVTEQVRSFNVSNFRPPWHWSDLVDLSVKFELRDNRGTHRVNHIYAVVTYGDTTAFVQRHYFVFDAIASPETLGLYFPIVARVMVTPGDTVMSSYSGTVNLTDFTGTVTPNIVTFAAGVCSSQVMIAQDTTTEITATDGDTSGTSNQFDVINPGLHHFGFDSIGAQIAGVAFPVNMAALDFYGDTVATFADKADLWDLSGTLTPDSSGAFVSGTWAGNLTIATAVPFDTLYCSRTIGGRTYYGASNGFIFFLGVSGEKPVPAAPGFCRLDVRPNPLYQKAEFTVYSNKAGRARIIIYNMLGQKAAMKELGTINPGTVKINWELGSALPQGLYFAGLQVDGKNTVFKKLIILK